MQQSNRETGIDPRVDRIVERWKRERRKNKRFPLPPDYDDLTADGRKQARVAVCCNQRTPEDLVLAWSFFCETYLKPPDTGFYKRYLQPARMHYGMIYDLGRYPATISAYPRSSAKTMTVTKAATLLFACTRPHFYIVLVLSKDKFITLLFDDLKLQIDENPYIRHDFGILRPKRGQGMWSGHAIRLTNKFKLVGIPITGTNRGPHPDLLILDDVEYDSENEASGPRLTAQLDFKMNRVYKPMMDSGTALYMTGTLVRNDSFLHRAQYSNDPQFASWNRRIVGVESEHGLLWAAKWSKKKIRQLRTSLKQHFASEMMNMPDVDGARLFQYDQDYHTYRISQPDPELYSSPCNSLAIVTRTVRPAAEGLPPETVSKPISEILRHSFRIMTIDWAGKQVSVFNDYSAIAVMAMDHEFGLWILDLWVGKKPRDFVVRQALKMAFMWRVRCIGPESVSVQAEMADIINRELQDKFRDEIGFIPTVQPLRYAYGVSKDDRISELEWRFERDKIFLPGDELDKWPWKALMQQILNWNGSCQSLRNDDAIDAVAMSTEVLRKRKIPSPQTKVERSNIRRTIEANREMGSAALHGVDVTKLTPSELRELRMMRADGEMDGQSGSRRSRRHKQRGRRDDVLVNPEDYGMVRRGSIWVMQDVV